MRFRQRKVVKFVSLSARRAWIEIFFRGWTLNINGSLSARRAWIEIDFTGSDWVSELSLSARRAWIEIVGLSALAPEENSRSPQGERG